MQSRLIPDILWLAVVSVIVMLPGFLLGPGATHSATYNFIWTHEFGAAIAQGNLYPRWLPDSFEGLGSPTFYFYPPLAYWLSGTINALGVSTLQAINIAGLILLFASGVAMHAWLSSRGTRPLLGSILYMVFPYHLLDFWVRGALAEFAAFIWLPLIALAINRLPQRRGVLFLALSYGALVISHLPMAMLTGIFMIAPMVVHRAWRDRSILLPAAIGGALGFGIAGFYLIPALMLQNHISTILWWSGGYQPSTWAISAQNFSILPCIGLAMIALSLWARSIWTVIAVVSSLAALNLIPFIWDIAPLDKAQFPWRTLCIAEFAAVTALLSCRPRPIFLGLGVALLLAPYLHSGIIAWGDLNRPVDYAAMARTMPDAPEYLPAGFDLSGITDDYRVAKLAPYRTLSRVTDIDVTHIGTVTFRRAAFPIWRVTRDGREVPSTGPVITFQAKPGHYALERVMIWQEITGILSTAIAATLLMCIHLFGLPTLRFPCFRAAPASSQLRQAA